MATITIAKTHMINAGRKNKSAAEAAACGCGAGGQVGAGVEFD
jgi:hypothetical protein